MKKIKCLAILLIIVATSVAQNNFPIQKIENVIAVTIPEDSDCFFSLEGHNDGNTGDITLVKRKLEKKEIIKKYSVKIPKTIIPLIVTDGKCVYFIGKDYNNERNAIYSINLKKDKIITLAEIDENIESPAWLEILDGYLILGNSIFKKQPSIFDIKEKQFIKFSENESLRLLCVSYEKDLIVVMDLGEANDDPIPVKVKTVKGDVSEVVGHFDSSLSFSSEDDGENHQPGFSFTNDAYSWVDDCYNYGMYPIGGFGIAMKQKLSADYMNLADQSEIRLILAYNGKFLIGSTKNNVVVYNIENPVYTNPLTVDNATTSSIKDFLYSKLDHDVEKLNTDSLDNVFDIQVYKVVAKEQLDQYTSTEKIFYVVTNGVEYQVLSDVSILKEFIKPGFKLNSDDDAQLLQSALNIIYPPDTFEKKHIRCLKLNNSWVFIRDKSFDEYEAIIAEINDLGEITSLSKINDLKIPE